MSSDWDCLAGLQLQKLQRPADAITAAHERAGYDRCAMAIARLARCSSVKASAIVWERCTVFIVRKDLSLRYQSSRQITGNTPAAKTCVLAKSSGEFSDQLPNGNR